MQSNNFRDSAVWQKAKYLAVMVYKITENRNFSPDLGLRDQIRETALHIACTISEVEDDDTDNESVCFFYIAKRSLAELQTQLEIAHEIGYLEERICECIKKECINLANMIRQSIMTRQQLVC